jgi:flavodoxin
MTMKLLVLYDSRSGNTEKMAEAVAEGAKEVKGVIPPSASFKPLMANPP